MVPRSIQQYPRDSSHSPAAADARQTFVSIWICRDLQSGPIEVWDGHQLRDFTFVDDAVDAFFLAALSDETNAQIFNLGGMEVVSLKDLAAILVEVNGRGAFVIRSFPPDPTRIDIGDYYADCGRIRSALGWTPRVPVRDGLARCLAFYREHVDRYL